MFTKVLIANRGEIALRIIRTLRDMGIRSVAVHSDVDRDSLHVQLADEAICIGGPRPAESYLNKVAVLQAALMTGAEAIHPGFGFLAENASFAKMCNEYGVTFIGPPSEVIDAMGNKSKARNTMKKAAVPIIPGTEGALADYAACLKEARQLGFPVLIKAAAGGGGKGMRPAYSEAELEQAYDSAKREAANAFGDDTLYLEKIIAPAKHIEVQILADNFGNVVHIGERDCSMQRNRQKVIEESPAASLNPILREEMGKAAVKAAKAAGYRNAGTIEFLLDEEGKFYFMEMNTRIQVEHAVSEEVSGLDLIKAQILIAAGEALPYKQKQIELRGHAIECRINAENPELNFCPSAGQITALHLPGGIGVRVDTMVYDGYDILPYYDAMIGKIITYGDNREEAIIRMRRALKEVIVGGINTNTAWLLELLNDPVFIAGNFPTTYLADKSERFTLRTSTC